MANQRLNAIITIGGTVAGSLKSALGTTQNGLKKIGQEIRDLEKKQKALGQQIDAPMGRNVRLLRQEYSQLGDAIDKARAKQERLQSASVTMNSGKALMASGAKGLGIVGAVAASGVLPVVQAAQFEDAMLGVAKQVKGARDENGKLTQTYHDMANAIQKMGREIPLATNDIADMVAAGARMGVETKDLLGFTRTSAMMASAFDLPAGELSESMGKIAGLYKIPIPAIGDLADKINWLDDNAISKGSDIIDFLTRTGGAAGQVRVTGGQMAALGSTLLTLGERAETAGTATNAMFGKLAAADKGTKKFQASLAELGLSARELQNGMQQDAEATLLKVMEAVNKLPETKRVGVLVDMFGMEHADTAGKLAANLKEYRTQIELVNSAGAKDSMAREFQAQLQTASAQFQIFKNRLVEVGVTVGSVLLPPLNEAMKKIGRLASGFADFAKANPAVTKAVVGTVVAVTSLIAVVSVAKIAIGALMFAFGAAKFVVAAKNFHMIGAALVKLRSAIVITAIAAKALSLRFMAFATGVIPMVVGVLGKLRVGLLVVGGALRALTLLMLTNPIGLAITGIAVGALLVVKYWKPLSGFFGKLFNSIKQTIGGAIDWALQKIAKVGDTWREIKGVFGFGDGGAAPAAVGRKPPPMPRMATGRGGRTVHDNSQTTIHVTQPAGSDGNAFARALAADNQRRAAGRQNSLLFDRPGG